MFNKKFVFGVATCTVLIICVCALFFEPKINIPLRKMMGIRCPMVSFIVQDGDNVLSAEQKLYEMFAQRKLKYAVAVRTPEKIPQDMVRKFQDRKTEMVYLAKHYGNDLAQVTSVFEFEDVFDKAKASFAQVGLKADYVFYPYAWRAEKAMKPVAERKFKAGFMARYVQKPKDTQLLNSRLDKYMVRSTGYGFGAPVTLEKFKEAVEAI